MDYWYTIVALACINSVMAWSVYMSFMTGTVSLGQAAFFAIGAFASASLTAIWGWHIVPATAVGALAGAIVGVGIAVPTLRLRGLYLTIATVAFVEVVRVVFHNTKYGREGSFAITRTDAGQLPWIGPDGPLGFRHITYLNDNHISIGEYAGWLAVVVVLLGIAIFLLERSRFGYALRAVAEDELAAQGVGLSHSLLKVIAFSMGAAVAAVAGSMYAHLLTFISGNDFGIPLTVMALAYVVIGGGQTFWGPLFGALLFTFLPEIIRFAKEFRLEIFGIAMLVTMIFRPQGIISKKMVRGAEKRISTIFRLSRGSFAAREANQKLSKKTQPEGSETMKILPKLPAILAVASACLFAGAAVAASLTLDDKQLAEAAEEGKAKYEMHPLAFKRAYFQDLGFGYPTVLLRTEYFAVADYVRRSEFQRKYGSQRVHELNDARIKSAQSEVNGQLQFLVTLYGKTENFANDFKYSLVVDGKAIEPSAVDTPQRAESSGFAGNVDFKADVIIDFPGKNLKGDEKITLIIDPPDGLGPSGARNENYEAKFDLSKLK